MSNGGSSGASLSPPTSSSFHWKPSKPVFHFLSGLTSGLLSATLLQPADLLKTRLQQARSLPQYPLPNLSSPNAATTTSTTPPLPKKSLLSSIHQIYNLNNPSRSLAPFWRGTLPSALRTGFGSAFYFASLNSLRTYVATHSSTNPFLPGVLETPSSASSSTLPKLTPVTNLLTGALARAFAGFLLSPMTIIKVRYESSLYSYTSIAGASRDILAKEGLKGFFAGWGATAARDAPYAGLYVLFYEECKGALSRIVSSQTTAEPLMLRGGGGGEAKGMKHSASATINFTSGVLAAALATAITNPFDAIKTRIQLQPTVYRNMWQAVRLMVAREGGRALFDGLGLRMGRKAASSALAWTVYEELVRWGEGVVFK